MFLLCDCILVLYGVVLSSVLVLLCSCLVVFLCSGAGGGVVVCGGV